jgi:hypothetical protein
MLFKYISVPVFLISFAIGLFVVYILGPQNKEIIIYPSPENINTYLFKDNAENCFSFEQKEVKCGTTLSDILSIPIQS